MQTQQGLITPTQLVSRIEALERTLRELVSAGTSRSAIKMEESIEEHRRQSEAKAKAVLKRTHGIISKGRGEQMLHDLEVSRNEWSRDIV